MPFSQSRFDQMRHVMVERQIAGRGIKDLGVLAAMREVPRHLFVPFELRAHAYEDTPLPIGANQTISQPFIVAYMLEALRLNPDDKVLEIGTGSGYSAALLARLVRDVFTIERVRELADQARENLAAAGFLGVHVLYDDGTLGCPAHAPYDAIIVDAAGPRIPESLKAQLKIGGRLVMPVDNEEGQRLIRMTRTSEAGFDVEELLDVRFVPLVGQEGWSTEQGR